ncbi:hypothetical protein AUC43_12960 [Hymenobacter sedentarius]|uniref:Uncharacterized protein n=1 Tax=Hymenobacter sedentarius TaxID=1411621 RepID=A0A0U3SIG8_9BACT|nr:hypothetical protein [Hymenobacter sedentarius]ALW85926.1 hypothetical protein AUC43_12960 [Hymenobacter sedentarius]
MKVVPFFTLIGIGLLAMSSSCEKELATPSTPLATGRLVRLETTVDDRGQSPRPRWEVEVSPLSFPGLTAGGVFGPAFQQVKVFDLPDTAVYRVGRSIQFRYRLVPQAQQTPWRTPYERYNTAPALAWGDRLPELILSEVELVPLQ